jgi:hypothetical protein
MLNHTSLALSFSFSCTSETVLFVLSIMFMSSAYPFNCTDLQNTVDVISTDSCLITYSNATLKRLRASPSPCFKPFPTLNHQSSAYKMFHTIF